ncbi:MAG: regulatory protein RecX [Solirubrobacterales bacterium]
MTDRRPPAKISPQYLENAALHYLERFASSSANLRRVLIRKVDRSLAHWGGEREAAVRQVEATLAKLARLGYLDDAAYAAQKVQGLHRRGKGVRAIRAALAVKGVAGDDADAALARLAEDQPEPDLVSAATLARKRRLGPWRPEDQRAATRQKDMAALARAGFDFDTARRVIDAATPEDIPV